MAVTEVETAQESPYQPTHDLVRATIHDLKALAPLPTRTTDGRWTSPSQATLNTNLTGLDDGYGHGISTAGAITILERVNSEDLAQPLRSRLRRFEQDLQYITLLESGGTERLNSILFNNFTELQIPNNLDHEHRIRNLNDLLSRAIYFAPYLARAVEVNFKHPSDQDTEDPQLKDRQSYFNGLSRGVNLHDGSKLDRVVLPLPYVSADDQDKTAEELSLHPKDHQSVWFTTSTASDGLSQVPSLAVKVIRREPEGFSFFPIVQVAGIRFLGTDEFQRNPDHEQFTPCLKHDRYGSLKIGAWPNWISHYLQFREFDYFRAYRSGQTDPEYDRTDVYIPN